MVIVRVNALQASIHSSVDPCLSCPTADLYLASRVVDAASRYLQTLCTDHILWTLEHDGLMTLAYVASAPGLVVDAQKTAQALCLEIGLTFA